MMLRLRQLLSLILTAFPLLVQETLAQSTVAADSSDFVTASILVVSPGREPFSVGGHCALRMRCPSHQLDYCFTYETDIDKGLYLYYLLGRTRGGLFVVPMVRYLNDHRKEGRGIKEYELNLTLKEERELWRLLDEELPAGLSKPFDFFLRNCSSLLYQKLLTALPEETIVGKDYVFGKQGNRSYFQKAENGSPWTFFWANLLTDYANPDVHIVDRLCPILMGKWLTEAEIVAPDGISRSLVSETPKELLKAQYIATPSQLTPTIVFSLLLAWVLVISICEYFGMMGRVVRGTDTLLFCLYTLVALLLSYLSVIRLFGGFGHRMLIPFNLLPPLLWLFASKEPWYHHVWPVYMIVLAAFAVFYPLYTGFLQWPFLLIFISLFIRCLCKSKTYYVQAR